MFLMLDQKMPIFVQIKNCIEEVPLNLPDVEFIQFTR